MSKFPLVLVVLLLDISWGLSGVGGSSIIQSLLQKTNPDRDQPPNPLEDAMGMLTFLGRNLTSSVQDLMAATATSMLRKNLGGPNHAVTSSNSPFWN